jgi:hypothetical protein
MKVISIGNLSICTNYNGKEQYIQYKNDVICAFWRTCDGELYLHLWLYDSIDLPRSDLDLIHGDNDYVCVIDGVDDV